MITAAQRGRAGSGTRAGSVGKAELGKRPQRRETVAPSDLLALVELATGVGDRDFVDADLPLQDLRGDLGLDVEAVAPQAEVGHELPVDELVTRLHVGERRVVQHVGDQREETVADPVEEEHVAAFAGEPRAVHDARLAAQHRRHELRPVLGVVLEVGVLDEDVVARRDLDPGAHCGALPAVVLVQDDADRAVAELAQHVAVPSPLPSSTTMISRSMPSGSSTARMRRSTSTTVLRSLNTGTITESLRSF